MEDRDSGEYEGRALLFQNHQPVRLPHHLEGIPLVVVLALARSKTRCRLRVYLATG